VKKFGLHFIFFALAACSWGETHDGAYDRGYSDGYAVGYNTTCEIRATMITGDWDTKGCKSGYDAGYLSGAEQCRIDEPAFR
jgi:hypothetical protein